MFTSTMWVQWLQALATTERTPTPGPPGMSVRFPVSQEIRASIPGSAPNFSAVSRLMRTRAIQNGEGDVNHERVSIPGVQAFSQQRLTSFDQYESAWRTANTGSNPVGATIRISLMFNAAC